MCRLKAKGWKMISQMPTNGKKERGYIRMRQSRSHRKMNCQG